MMQASKEVVWDNTYMLHISDFEWVSCDNIEEFLRVLSKNEAFNRFECNTLFSDGKGKKLGIGVQYNRRTLEFTVRSNDIDLVNSAHVFLKDLFKARNPSVTVDEGKRVKYLQPTVFIGRHFDELGDEYYRILEMFLTLLGFEVKQGEEYSSETIPDKVRSRIDTQDIYIGIVSGDREHPWLIAEPAYALGKGKHTLLLAEKETRYDPTILGRDFQQLRFPRGQIEKTFTSLLREFRAVRIKGL